MSADVAISLNGEVVKMACRTSTLNGLIVVVLGFIVLGAGSAGAFNWKAFKGEEIKILANRHPWTDLITAHIGEFEELTGIKVELDVYPEDQFRTKRTVELVAGVSDVDAFMFMPGQVLAPYTRSGWLAPLNGFLASKRLLWPSFDVDDIFGSSIAAGHKNGKQYSIPLMLETSILAYNKELLAKYGVAVPKTLQELEAAAKRIYEASQGRVYGVTLRGKRAAATSCWVGFLHSFGGQWLIDGKAGVHAPEAVTATDYYGRLLRLYGPKSAPNNSWYESVSIFMQGKAAMIFDSGVFKKNYEDSVKSLVHGKVGYTTLPRGPAGSIPPIFSWSLGIYAKSKQKEATWLFVQWATGKEMALRGQMVGIPAARKSAWQSPLFRTNDKTPEWTEASIASFEVGSPVWNPPVVSVAECRDAMGSAIAAALLGKNVQTACDKAAKKINAILRTEK
jgi:multiple sugar transport system substrate-binding protein